MAAFKIFRKFADLLDRSTVDLPAINTPLADALAGKATSAQGALADTAVQEGDSPSFVDVDASGTVTAGSLTTTGSVGVGTDTPESLLHVFNQATSGNISSLVIEHTGSNFGPALKVKGGLNPQILLESGAIRAKLQVSGGVAVFGTESNSKFSVFTNNTAKLTVATDGNVGIGTTSPAEKLDVVGNIKASGTVTAGSLTTYQITITGATANGILKAEAGRLAIFEGVTPIARFHASYGVMIGTQGIVGGSSATGADTILSRVSAGTWGIGTTSKGSTDGNLSLANLTASGTVTVGGVGSDYPSVDLLGNIEPRLYLKTGTSGAKGKVGYNISNSTFGFTNYGGGAFKFFNSTSEVLTISNTGDLTASGTVTAAGATFNGLVSQTGLGGSTYFGEGAGVADDLSSNYNVGIGFEALKANTSGSFNIASGISRSALTPLETTTLRSGISLFEPTTLDTPTLRVEFMLFTTTPPESKTLRVGLGLFSPTPPEASTLQAGLLRVVLSQTARPRTKLRERQFTSGRIQKP